MLYRIYLSAKTGQHEIIEDADYEFGMSADRARTECDKLNAELNARRNQPETPAQTQWFVVHGVPSTKSLKNLDAKLSAIKRAEEIENGSEEM